MKSSGANPLIRMYPAKIFTLAHPVVVGHIYSHLGDTKLLIGAALRRGTS